MLFRSEKKKQCECVDQKRAVWGKHFLPIKERQQSMENESFSGMDTQEVREKTLLGTK